MCRVLIALASFFGLPLRLRVSVVKKLFLLSFPNSPRVSVFRFFTASFLTLVFQSSRSPGSINFPTLARRIQSSIISAHNPLPFNYFRQLW